MHMFIYICWYTWQFKSHWLNQSHIMIKTNPAYFETLALRVQKTVETVQYQYTISYTAGKEETIRTCTLISRLQPDITP